MNDIDVPSAAWQEMERRRRHIVDLRGGTLAMRDAGELWLPRFPREQVAAYRRRLAGSHLYEATADTIAKLSAKPFSKPMRILGDLPEILMPIQENADRAGSTLHNVSQQSFEDACAYGMSALFVDAPMLTGTETLAFVRSKKIYPSITMVGARDIIYARAGVAEDGMKEPREIRIREWMDAPDEEGNCYTIRVLKSAEEAGGDRATWEVYTRVKGEWALSSSGFISHRKIPIVPWYTRQCGFMRAHSPIEGLAWLNIEHWQSSSDQRNILSFARIAQPYVAGVQGDEEDKLRESGGDRLLTFRDANTKVGYLEHSGAAIAAGERDLEKLERRMETLGLQPFMEKVADSTATGVMANQGGTMTLIQKWIRDCESAVLRALIFAHEIMGESVAKLDPDLRVEIFSDFTTPGGSKDAFANLDKMRGRGDIDQRTILEEAQRYGILAENRSVDEIMERSTEERGALTMFAQPANPVSRTPPSDTPDPHQEDHAAGTQGSLDDPKSDSQAA